VTSSVDGLVSGLSTSSLISSLMQVEAAPQDRLKTKVTTAQAAVTSYQSVNSKLSALKSAADDLGHLSTWRAVKPASSSTSVTATAVGGTNNATGTIAFDVVHLAKGQISTARVDPTAALDVPDSLTIQIGSGTPVTIDVSANKTAQGISDAINAAGVNVKSTVVTTGGAQNVLQLTGTKTGQANAFTVAGLENVGLVTAVPAQNAELQVGGTEAEGGYTVTSDSNTFTGLMAGVTLTVGKEEKGVTVSVASDVSGIAAKFQTLVDAANAALSEIGAQTAYDASSKKSSPLTGDFTVREMSGSILSFVSRGLSWDDPTWVDDPNDPNDKASTVPFGSLSQLGIQLDSSGKLTFDKDKFTAAYNADPARIQTAGIALADQVESLAGKQSDSITAVITGRKNEIDSMNSQIDNWDIRLAAKREALQKQYSDLETALSNLKSQSTWLSGQISSLG
jgi:flagellar hook-associated protein 2